MTQVLGIVKEGKLIPEELWVKFISGMENDFDNLETNNERAKREVAEAVVNSVKKRVTCEVRDPAHQVTPKFGILFSGGVDSSLISFISKQLKCNFTCYTVGIEGSDDIMWAQQVAKEYSFNFKYKILTLDEFETVLKETIKILNDADIVKASVGSVLHAAGKIAAADGSNILFGGLGSEEIFAGYQRHSDVLGKNNFEALHKECWSGLKNMWKRDLVRDFTIAKKLGIELRTPFLDKDLINAAMNVHPMLKIDKDNKKIILREAAEFLGLKKEFAWRKKQAAQYGSNFVNGIEKLAKRKGFKMKKDYLMSLLK
ncbi:MAG TPA: asparagine synthase C-terminal domain-containing protein [Candidatus Nanoarchaeia archaeon]|nr:asparagine synthase C-terminal domain-containing protein [Candidatus Nanoarchaeia archaeon]